MNQITELPMPGTKAFREALKGEMDRRIVYGNKGFVQEMTAAYKISEKIKPKGRQMGWRKNKENRPL